VHGHIAVDGEHLDPAVTYVAFLPHRKLTEARTKVRTEAPFENPSRTLPDRRKSILPRWHEIGQILGVAAGEDV
jgi:hypothetical protein